MNHSPRDFQDTGQRRDPSHICLESAKFLKGYLRVRRERDWLFPKGLFSDPAWDILLELYVAQSEDRPIYEFLIGPAVAIPEKSGLRWLGILETRKLVTRQAPQSEEKDPRILLTPNAIAGLNRWLESLSAIQPGNADTV